MKGAGARGNTKGFVFNQAAAKSCTRGAHGIWHRAGHGTLLAAARINAKSRRKAVYCAA